MTADPPTPSRWRFIGHVLRAPLVVLVWLWFLIDETLVAALRPVVRWLFALPWLRQAEAWIARQNRWVSLAILGVPLVLIEPPKVFAVLIIGQGHVRRGVILLIASYLLGLVLVERVFHIVRPKLMTIGWFALAYGWWERLRDWATGIVTASAAYRWARARIADAKALLRPVVAQVARMFGRQS